jgi:hypothetical protein
MDGRVPEEDERHPPRAAPGSRHLPWDVRSIPARQADLQSPDRRALHGRPSPPGAGGWDGEFVFARAVGGDSGHGNTTSATAGNRDVWTRCIAGRQPSGSGIAAPILRDASGMPRRNVSDANRRHLRPRGRIKATFRRAMPPPTRARGHAASGIPRFFVIVLAVTSRRGILRGWPPATVATSAVRPWIGSATASASGCGASGKRAASNAAWNTRLHEPDVASGMFHRTAR